MSQPCLWFCFSFQFWIFIFWQICGIKLSMLSPSPCAWPYPNHESQPTYKPNQTGLEWIHKPPFTSKNRKNLSEICCLRDIRASQSSPNPPVLWQREHWWVQPWSGSHGSGEWWENLRVLPGSLPFYHWKKTSSSCLAVTFLYKSTKMSSKQLEGLLNVYFQCHESYLFENWMMEEDLSAHSKMASSWDALPWCLSLTPHHANLTAPLQPTTTTLRSRNKKTKKCPANHRQSEHLIPTFFFSTGSSHMPNCQDFLL